MKDNPLATIGEILKARQTVDPRDESSRVTVRRQIEKAQAVAKLSVRPDRRKYQLNKADNGKMDNR